MARIEGVISHFQTKRNHDFSNFQAVMMCGQVLDLELGIKQLILNNV